MNSLILDPDVSFDPGIDFGFDEDIFIGAFEEESEKSPTAEWFEDFTIRVSRLPPDKPTITQSIWDPSAAFPRKPI